MLLVLLQHGRYNRRVFYWKCVFVWLFPKGLMNPEQVRDDDGVMMRSWVREPVEGRDLLFALSRKHGGRQQVLDSEELRCGWRYPARFILPEAETKIRSTEQVCENTHEVPNA